MKKALFLCMMFALCLTMAVQAQSPCDPPTNVNVVPGATSATVSWTGSAEQYNVQYSSSFYYCGADVDCVSDWSIYDVDGDGYNWYLDYMGRSGADDDIAFVSDSYYYDALDPDNWLITPIINLGGTMSVWMKSYSPYYLDMFAIYLTTDLDFDEVEDFNIPLVVKSVAPDEWTEYTADLSAYAGQQGYIAIRHFNSYDRHALLMDDFRVDGEGIMLSNVSNPAEISGLNPETTYIMQVQGICEDGVTGWSEPVEFTTPACVISEINIEGFTTPEWGANPDYDVNVPENANYSLGDIFWNWAENEGTPAVLQATETFNNENANYYMVFNIIPNEGCSFAEDVTVKVDNNPSTILISAPFGDGYLAATQKFKVTEPTTEPCEISTIEIEGFTAPAWGAHPDLEVNVPEDAHYSLAYKFWKWYDAETHYSDFLTASETFDNENYTYYMIFKINPNGCTISNDVTITINGDASLVYYNWNELSNEGRFYSIDFEIEEPTEEPIEPGECGLATDCDGHSYPTIRIGDVCWMQKNLAAESCVTSGNVYSYVNDQFPDEAANVATYGRLYDEAAVMQGIGAKAATSTGICPTGYRLPTVAEIEALGAAYSADELKSTDYWISGGAGSDLSGFSWLPGGCYSSSKDNFESMLLEGYLWATEEVGGVITPAMYKITYYCGTILMRVEDHSGLSASVRCVKEAEPETFTCGTSKMKDAEGHEYETVLIGTQCWTKTNLRVAPAGATDETSSGASSKTEPYYYVNSAVDPAVYGYYYNWEAAKLACPIGWHLPSDAEWTTMEQTQTSMDVTGSGLRGDHAGKLAGEGWNPSTIAGAPGNASDPDHNASGFSAVPAGYCGGSSFSGAGNYATFWSSTQYSGNYAYIRYLDYSLANVLRDSHNKANGYSVRCLRD